MSARLHILQSATKLILAVQLGQCRPSAAELEAFAIVCEDAQLPLTAGRLRELKANAEAHARLTP